MAMKKYMDFMISGAWWVFAGFLMGLGIAGGMVSGIAGMSALFRQ